MTELPFILSLLEHGVKLLEVIAAKAPSKLELDAELTGRLQRIVDRIVQLPARFKEYDAALAARGLPKP